MEKVRRDREVAMKQKDALVKTLSEAANALESSLKVFGLRMSSLERGQKSLVLFSLNKSFLCCR
jgi:hypothetical protein